MLHTSYLSPAVCARHPCLLIVYTILYLSYARDVEAERSSASSLCGHLSDRHHQLQANADILDKGYGTRRLNLVRPPLSIKIRSSCESSVLLYTPPCNPLRRLITLRLPGLSNDPVQSVHPFEIDLVGLQDVPALLCALSA
jgi:hypothetical protein